MQSERRTSSGGLNKTRHTALPFLQALSVGNVITDFITALPMPLKFRFDIVNREIMTR